MHLFAVMSPPLPNAFVFARTEDNAVALYTQLHSKLGKEPQTITMDRLDGIGPLRWDRGLKLSLARDIEGIGERNYSDGTWTITPAIPQREPDAWPSLALGEHKMVVSVTGLVTGDQLVIFAQSQQRANGIVLRFITMLGEMPDEWLGDEWVRFQKQGIREQLDVVLAGREEGLGIYDELGGWSVFSLPEELDHFSKVAR